MTVKEGWLGVCLGDWEAGPGKQKNSLKLSTKCLLLVWAL